MEEPDWAKVLSVLYAEEDSVYRQMEGDLSESHNLVTESGLEADNVEGALAFLRDQGLIETGTAGGMVPEGEEEVRSTHIEYELTEKGFEVAHKRELREQQQDLMENQNKSTDTLADFTIILAVTALVQALAAIISVPRYRIPLSVIYAGILGILLYKKDDWFHGV